MKDQLLADLICFQLSEAQMQKLSGGDSWNAEYQSASGWVKVIYYDTGGIDYLLEGVGFKDASYLHANDDASEVIAPN